MTKLASVSNYQQMETQINQINEEAVDGLLCARTVSRNEASSSTNNNSVFAPQTNSENIIIESEIDASLTYEERTASTVRPSLSPKPWQTVWCSAMALPQTLLVSNPIEFWKKNKNGCGNRFRDISFRSSRCLLTLVVPFEIQMTNRIPRSNALLFLCL